MTADWNDRDIRILWEWMLRGVYELTWGVIGRSVYVPVVFKHIEMKGYWGNEKALAKYFKFRDDDDVYKNNVGMVTRWMAGQGYLKDTGGQQVSLTRKGRAYARNRFRELTSI